MNWFKNLFRGRTAGDTDGFLDESTRNLSDTAEKNHHKGNQALQAGDLAEAESAYRESMRLVPDDPRYALSLGFVLYERKAFEEASITLERAFVLDPTSADTAYCLGRVRTEKGDIATAEELFASALTKRSRFDVALDALVNLLVAQSRLDEARERLLDEVRRDPEWLAAQILLGLLNARQGNWSAATAALESARSLAPQSPEVLLPLLKCLIEQQEFIRALGISDELLRVAPTLSSAHEERIRLLIIKGENEAALTAATDAVSLQPRSPTLHHLLGVLLQGGGRKEDAVLAFRSALSLDPLLIESRLALAAVEAALLRYDDATASIREAVRQRPDTPFALGHLALAEWSQLQWHRWQEFHDTICERLKQGQRSIDPFNFLLVSDSLELQRQCASLAKDERISARRTVHTAHQKIRIAYLSPDFRNHAVSFLMAGAIEAHDRDRFEVYGFGWGPHPEDAMGRRIRAAFDIFLDISKLNDDESANTLREYEIDIAVDLAGYTGGARPGIFARRAAPVQVNYLGFPATMGVPYLDYIIADHYTIPVPRRDFYSEKVVYLPTCFQANDDRRGGLNRSLRRDQFGLPEDGFVFCSFHSTPKVTPAMFDIWMRLLHRTPESVLWILCNSSSAKANLYREAHARGIGEDRLVIAEDMDYESHLARHRLADLFLDTLPFNAGTSASDALWAGLPIVTCSGEAFAARMAGSLLVTLELPELVSTTLSEYEAVAGRLAEDRALLQSIRDKLWVARESSGLFSSQRVCHELESAYAAMFRSSARGEIPAMIDLSDSTSRN